MQSYCLDIYIGLDDREREDFLELLHGVREEFEITTCERCHRGKLKILRVVTPKAAKLQEHLVRQKGKEQYYIIHYSKESALKNMDCMPDFNHPLGHGAFDLSRWRRDTPV